MAKSDKHAALVDPKLALSVYFDSLLTEVPDEPEPEPSVERAPAPAAPAPVIEAERPLPRMPLNVPAAAPQAPPVQAPAEPVAPPAEALVPAATPKPEPDAGPPAYAAEPFQVLLFRVAGVRLAVPLVELHGILEWPEQGLSQLPGHGAWHLGLLHERGQNIPVADVAHLIVPADKLAQVPEETRRLRRVVLIDGGRWGLACSEVEEVITLQAEQVRWRTVRTKRRWLAGTVLEQMCALLDSAALARLLRDGREANESER